MKFRLSVSVALLLAGIAVVSILKMEPREMFFSPPGRSTVNQGLTSVSKKMSGISSQSISIRKQETHSRSAWDRFRDQFGEELQAQFGPNGKLGSIRGRVSEGKRAGADFDPENPAKAIARAREILVGAKELLGLAPGLSLAKPLAKTSATSAQVFFTETQGGVPLAPYGTVSVNLGSEGELVEMDSTAVSGIKPVNTVAMSPDTAKLSAESAVKETAPSAIPTTGGREVLWVPDPMGVNGVSEGRYAFEYWVQGRQVIVDASSGKVLYKRDRRMN